MNHYLYLLLVPLLPFLGFLLLGLAGKDRLQRSAGYIATVLLFLATAISFVGAYQYFSAGSAIGSYEKFVPLRFNWLQFAPGLSIDMGILIDPLSVMMIALVCFISLMVHLYSVAYMKDERRRTTYFAFLSLFTFSMLGLILSSNIFQTYIFWELVGVSSYLLIGFYFERPAAVAAAKKAFIVTRFADAGFLVGILILGYYGGSFDFQTLTANFTADGDHFQSVTTASFLGISMLTWGLSLVFMGGAGKSALFPLHIWLPDAMEGPTPVSALIHAATMVVAGVYLVARLFPVFALDVTVMQLVTWTGLVSAMIAALIACTQDDIKRVLAYSTMSQIGFMMFSLGVAAQDAGGYSASLFHLFTHAFFKSLLFLCAGILIHYMHSNRMQDMGGLRKALPLTHTAFLIGCLAIAGIPPFAGFFSKESVLLAAWHADKTVYLLAIITSALTAFYMFRMYFLVFWNKAPRDLHGHTSSSMQIPLIVLSSMAVVAGFIPFAHFVSPDGKPATSEMHLSFAILPVGLSLLMIAVAWVLFHKPSAWPAKAAAAAGSAYQFVQRKFYIDELYLFLTKRVLFPWVGRPAAWFDRNVVDGMMNGLAQGTAMVSARVKGWQSGSIQSYVLYFFAGIAGLAILFIYLWK